MKFETREFLRGLLWSLELHPNRRNLKYILHKDILGFFIVSQKLFHTTRRNLIVYSFSVFSYGSVNFSLIDTN
jgi:hypothetical protein